MADKKVIVIGLDGGTWNVIEPLVNEGKLPTIASLMKQGCYGNLESSIPSVTFPAWKCYSTGKNPGKLGVYGHFDVNIKKQKFVFNNSSSFKSKEVWDYLGERDEICGVIGMPTTYPPKRINGFMITEGAVNESRYTYPKILGPELKEKFNYKFTINDLFEKDKDRNILEFKKIVGQRFEVAKYLLIRFKPTFFNLTIFYTDSIQHFYWKYMENNDEKYGKVIEDFWMLIDEGIKSVLEEFHDEEIYVVLMSDHGFTSTKAKFNISQWLIEKGYLVLKSRKVLLNILYKLGYNKYWLDRAISIFKKLRILPLLRKIPDEWKRKILLPAPDEEGGIRGKFAPDSIINWEKSKVIPTQLGPIYINTNVIPLGEEYEIFRNQLIEEIKTIKNPNTGENLAKEVYKGEEIYTKYTNRPVDIVIEPNDGYEIFSIVSSEELWNFSRAIWSGTHKLHGIFCINGPDIKKGVKIQGAKIYDLAPTILHIFGTPIPKDMDGRVLKEIFKEASKLAKREIVYQKIDEKRRVEEKINGLKALGKI